MNLGGWLRRKGGDGPGWLGTGMRGGRRGKGNGRAVYGGVDKGATNSQVDNRSFKPTTRGQPERENQ